MCHNQYATVSDWKSSTKIQYWCIFIYFTIDDKSLSKSNHFCLACVLELFILIWHQVLKQTIECTLVSLLWDCLSDFEVIFIHFLNNSHQSISYRKHSGDNLMIKLKRVGIKSKPLRLTLLVFDSWYFCEWKMNMYFASCLCKFQITCSRVDRFWRWESCLKQEGYSI